MNALAHHGCQADIALATRGKCNLPKTEFQNKLTEHNKNQITRTIIELSLVIPLCSEVDGGE